MTEETKAKIRAAHKKLAESPARLAKLREIANNPAYKAARSAKMKALWADPEWRAAQLAKMPTTTGAREVVEPVAKAKRVVSAEKKAQYAAARKAKRATANMIRKCNV